MPYAKRLILHAPPWDARSLEVFVEECIRDGVVLVCVFGPDCERVHDVIDELVVGDASDDSRFLMTSWHTDETLEEVREFAESYTLGLDPQEPIQEVRLPPD
jgi:hypothetical protein